VRIYLYSSSNLLNYQFAHFTSMKNRSRLEIFASILHFVAQDREGLSLTRIMYLTYLSYTQSRECLSDLVENSMLVLDIDNKRYIITEKGHRFLHLVEELEKMLGFRHNSNEVIER
jgi:predicted transcriptional regulator